MIAVLVAVRRPRTEPFATSTDDDGGPISLDIDFTAYSYASTLKASAKLKLDGVSYPIEWGPMETPQNAPKIVRPLPSLSPNGQAVSPDVISPHVGYSTPLIIRHGETIVW